MCKCLNLLDSCGSETAWGSSETLYKWPFTCTQCIHACLAYTWCPSLLKTFVHIYDENINNCITLRASRVYVATRGETVVKFLVSDWKIKLPCRCDETWIIHQRFLSFVGALIKNAFACAELVRCSIDFNEVDGREWWLRYDNQFFICNRSRRCGPEVITSSPRWSIPTSSSLLCWRSDKMIKVWVVYLGYIESYISTGYIELYIKW